MNFHIYAVWDFMSLAKSLQNSLACQDIPWVPVERPDLARLINDIILTEESDVNIHNEAQSHFGMYLDAMQDMGLSTEPMTDFIRLIKKGTPVSEALRAAKVRASVVDFVESNFQTIASNKVHMVASSFAFGRETMIPAMFLQILKQKRDDEMYKKFVYYLERHVEVDRDEHGPAALEMIKTLCGTDPRKWEEATLAATKALENRHRFWDAIADALITNDARGQPQEARKKEVAPSVALESADAQLAALEATIAPLQRNLESHRLYSLLNSVDAVCTFMNFHIYAVWDFMSLAKSLQNSLACQDIPWVPVERPDLARLINDIILTEESDVNIHNEAQSHFGMYLDAMQDMGLSTEPMTDFIRLIKKGTPVSEALRAAKVRASVVDFVESNFQTIASNKVHMVASSFAFGRETMIPAMFLQILKQKRDDEMYKKFVYYLERHVEVDRDEHGPAALEMIKTLCGTDPRKWEEATLAATKALENRHRFWDAIADALGTK